MAEIKNNETGMILKLTGLSVGYKNKTIISNIDLNVKKGEIISLAGSNGCGKSTLLRTLAGQQKALSGSILLDGQNMALYNDISLAKKVSILLTDRVTPLLMTAYDVVCSGRYPYTGRLGILSHEDEENGSQSDYNHR